MKQSNSVFEHYLRSIINNEQFDHQIPTILNSFSYLHLTKNSYFVKEGDVCAYFCYVEEGVLQHYINTLDEEKTTYLALKNTSTSALKSFKNKIPSRKNIKAICDSKLWVITQEDFSSLMKSNDGFRTFYHNLIENQIFLIDDYRIDLLILSPEERYKKLIKNDLTLLNQVPLHYLASFLGISTRHMSRIRKNIK